MFYLLNDQYIMFSIYLLNFFLHHSFFWGYLADTKGLKKITIISCSMLTANTLAFGFSSSFYWAIITRFLQGCSIGLLVTCKAYISVVCDNTNMAFGMTAITTSFYTGMIIGPAMGGESSHI